MTRSPETTAAQVRDWCEQGIVNIVGGCCGTTPAHIAAIAKTVRGYPPRTIANARPPYPAGGHRTHDPGRLIHTPLPLAGEAG